MTSNPLLPHQPQYDQAYVWIWLPGATQPVVAGLLKREPASAPDGRLIFIYGQSYLARDDAIAIYDPELPLQPGVIAAKPNMALPSAIRDAGPDAWGQRVIVNRVTGLKGAQAAQVNLDDLTYLMESGSDRIGMLDFQQSPTDYVPRQRTKATLDELMRSAERVEQGIPLTPALDQALQHGTSLGGARPKALIDYDGIDDIGGDACKYIAKFSASNDLYNVVKAEYIAMRLAAKVGLNVAPVKLTRALGKDVLLIKRFDRAPSGGGDRAPSGGGTGTGWLRRGIVSALTLLNLDESEGRYASYQDLAELIRQRFDNPRETLQELFARLVFNILCGNTDDHARNHAAFWDGKALNLTPAYDICPQGRTGGEASQAMLIVDNKRLSQLSICLEAAGNFLLTSDQAQTMMAHQITTIQSAWEETCAEAKLNEVDRRLLWRRQFLNPFALQGLPPVFGRITL